MKNSKKVIVAAAVLFAMTCQIFWYGYAYSTGYNKGSAYTKEVYEAILNDELEELPPVSKEPSVSTLSKIDADTVYIAATLMPEYGKATLDSNELSSDTVYRICAQIPDLYLYDIRTQTGGSLDLTAHLFLPETVKAGEEGYLAISITARGSDRTFIGAVTFTATEDLSFIGGNSSVCYDSAGGDIEYDNGKLAVKFYTGATSEYQHQSYCFVSSSDGMFKCFYCTHGI